MPAPLLRIEGLTAAYGAAEVLHGIDLSLAEGEALVVLGANGAGKTTLLRAISGFVRRSGSVALRGEPIVGLRPQAIASRGIAHVPESRGTFAELSVDDNLRLGAYCNRSPKILRESLTRAYDLFPRLLERRRQQAGSLSGGEQQMLAIARALMMRPRLLMLDEPSFGLAPIIVSEIYSMLARIRSEEAVSMLIVEQHADVALGLADTACVLELGRVSLSGPAGTVADDPGVQRAYLGY
ncbi:MAG: ABC transporter ATP-binding protein [Burkholderiales bacterium]